MIDHIHILTLVAVLLLVKRGILPYIKGMKSFSIPLLPVILLILSFSSLWAEGQGEIPQDFEKTWNLENRQKLSLKGPFAVEIRWSQETRVTAAGPQGLVEQLWVSDWLETISLALERGVGTGLDEGNLKVIIQMPPPESILLGDRVQVNWLAPLKLEALELQVRDKSSLEGPLELQSLFAVITWQSKVLLEGRVEAADLTLKDQSEVDLRALEVGQGLMNVYDSAILNLDRAGTWRGEVGRLGMVKAFGEKPEAVRIDPTGVWLP
jgi:hypothetical protein